MKDGGEKMGIVEMTLSDQEFFFFLFFPSFIFFLSTSDLGFGVLGGGCAVGCVGLVYLQSFL